MLKSQRIKGQSRRSALITGSGVGSIIAIGDESWMIAGLDEWNFGSEVPELSERRLARKLGVRGFRLPAATGKDRGFDVPIVRFPQMVTCAGCADEKKRAPLDWHGRFTRGVRNVCEECGGSLAPSRFVMVCERGHIDEFPYFQWLHKGMDFDRNESGKHKMKLMSRGGGSLSEMVLSCSCGITPRTMEGALDKNALRGYRGCQGARPWLGDNEVCDCQPRGLQRGASNVYFSVTESSLSIPPWSEGVDKVIESWWKALKSCPTEALESMVTAMEITKNTPFSPRDIVKAVLARKGEGETQTGDLKIEEYDALQTGKKEVSREQDFVCVPSTDALAAVGAWFDQVMLVTRVREVVALLGFSRLAPIVAASEPNEEVAWMAPLWKNRGDWLPATEVRGEGVFLRLNEARLNAWENQPDVRARAAHTDAAWSKRCESFKIEKPYAVSARLMLIHTLAHALIRTWALDCGYAASSLRERLYVAAQDEDKPMSGFLIYTASSDSAGSLGGLTLMGGAGRLQESLEVAINDASWCSSDPLCLEAEAGGTDGLNGAACHACVLLPESSCERHNMMLDRAFLVGTIDNPTLGFFADLMRS